jgi:hypothetical protein
VRDALARLRAKDGLPRELPPDIVELVRVQASAACDPCDFAGACLVGQEVFWSRFALFAEQTLADTAACWEVVKAARLQLDGYTACLSRLFRSAWEAELARTASGRDDPRLPAVSRALEGQWVNAAELGYDLAHHHLAVVAERPTALQALAGHTERETLLVEPPGEGIT